MLFVLLHLLFKITPFNAISTIQKDNSHKIVKSVDKCWDNLKNGQFSEQSYNEYVVYCHNQLNPPVFKMMTTNTNGAHSTSSNSKVFKIRNVECNIQTCTFSNCIFHDSLINYEGTNNNYLAKSNTISNCYDGSSPSSANIMYVNSRSTTIQENTITYTSVDQACRSFRIFNNIETTISGNQVTNANINTNSVEKGVGIYISDSSAGNPVHINDNKFTTCGKSGSLYIVFLNVRKFEFNYNKITFSDSLTSCGCVSSERSTELVYIGNVFENAKLSNVNDDKWRSAGIDQDSKATNQETVTIENNTFDNIIGINQGRCIFLSLYKPNMIFRENTFQNCPSGSFFIKIIIDQLMNEILIESCNFIKNTLNTEWDGTFGSVNQMIIQNQLRNDCSMPYKLILENCLFEQNSSPLKGGGFHYGFNRYGSNTIIYLIGCQFINNVASQMGGAVAIQSYQGFLIDNCTFKGNSAQQGGGAIYIETDSFCHNSLTPSGNKEEESIIRNCIFESNSGNEGHCINVQNISTTSIQILSNKFTNCGTNNYVIIFPNSNVKGEIENCTFEYSDEQASATAISAQSNEISIIGSTFKKCNSNTIHLQGTTEITTFELIENLFYYCYRGTIIKSEDNKYIQSPKIKCNTFENVHLTGTASIYLSISSETNSNSLAFENNTFKSFDMNCDQGGIGLEIKRKNTIIIEFIFDNCYFIGNSNNNTYFCGGLRIDYYQNFGSSSLLVTNCLFESNINNRGAGLQTCTTSGITIEDTIFRENSGNEGSSIYFNPDYNQPPKSDIIIRNCTFEHNPSRSKSSIYFCSGKSKSIRIENCQFKEEQGCIYIQEIESNPITIESCYFIKTSLMPSILITQTKAIQQLTISQCIFDECSSPGNKCLQISTKTPIFSFMDNVIKNCQLSGYNNYCGTINLNNALSTFELNNVTFSNNTSNSLKGGGSSIKIDGTNKIIFTECHFINNHAYQNQSYTPPETSGQSFNGCGGGIQLFSCETLNVDLTMTGCIFEGNEAENHGGGISIEKFDTTNNHEGILIENCQFIENTANQKGGSIYFGSETTCPGTTPIKNEHCVSVLNCSFERNNGNDGHCMYVESLASTDIQIEKCNFINCGSNNYVLNIPINDLIININNCTFEYSNEQASAAAISSQSNEISIIGSTFKKCNANTIHLRGTTEITTFELIENLFYYCYRGTIINIEETAKVQSPVIKGNTFDDVHLSQASLFLPLTSNAKSSSIIFDNNTFKSFVMNTEIGGVAIRVFRPSNSRLEIIFESCYFIGNTNNNVQHQGGGLRIDFYQNAGKSSFRLTKCFFENNVNQMGAALCFCVNFDVNIEECTFIGNNGHNGSAIYIIPDYDKDKNALVTISRCYFNNNQGSAKSSICCKEGTTKDIRIESCTFEEDQGSINVPNLGSKSLTIESTNFIKINTYSAIIVSQTTSAQQIIIDLCLFDGCSSLGNKCLQISSFTPKFSFSNSIIQNCQSSGCENYCGTINLNNQINSLELTNVSFINNTSNSLYGGGSSIIIFGVSQITFNQCEFTNNCACQDQSQSRPTSSSEPYYNGDGGAIQIGYWCKTNDMDISFTGCNFKGNQAERHGGAISIQTLKTVSINNCNFENNVANCNFEQTNHINLKENNFENHFHKKTEGRGGAIYVNPSYSYSKDGLDCPTTTSIAMQSFTVMSSTFTKNNACDGYAMYIEGDESGTIFDIKSNTFRDNYNESNYIVSPDNIYGAVITTEIRLQENTIISLNTWSFENTQLKVKEIQFVDHYGNTLSVVFTLSDAFTKSDYFPSIGFTNSRIFTQSNHFSSSEKFTQSSQFSRSKYFSKSDAFTHSNLFSKSDDFTYSKEFSRSMQFSKSNPFNETKLFSDSQVFTFSKDFSLSKQFSESEIFSYSETFSRSSFFSPSRQFSKSKDFSASQLFSKTEVFSMTKQFSESTIFSYSEQFTRSLPFTISKQFSSSKMFSNSEQFSKTGDFSLSKQFTESEIFSISEQFTQSIFFSSSNQFSKSELFSLSQPFSESKVFSISKQFSESAVFSSSEQFSISFPFSISKQFSNSNAFSSSEPFSCTKEFTFSKQFSESAIFTFSEQFSGTSHFSSSMHFSGTEDFSKSQHFSKTEIFSLSKQFSETIIFSYSEHFSRSITFSISSLFSKSEVFSISQQFSKTGHFSLTKQFSETELFSYSEQFSKSSFFSSSKQFSESEDFSSSRQFSKSESFTLTKQFSESEIFSISEPFTNTFYFSQSKQFSESEDFSKSKQFSKTEAFSLTKQFSESEIFSISEPFTNSFYFSQSKQFSETEDFSSSLQFSETDLFSLTKQFSESTIFSISGQFSRSLSFSTSNQFSNSKMFSSSYPFSVTKEFTLTGLFSYSQIFSKSDCFSKSNLFSGSMKFSSSLAFSRTGIFSLTNDFSISNRFSISTIFTLSTKFSQSTHFSLSNDFSNTNHFSLTEEFTISTKFTNSNKFTLTTKFTESSDFSPSKEFDPTVYFSQSSIFTKSTGFSLSNEFTKSLKFSISNDFSQSNEFTSTFHFSSTTKFTKTNHFTYSNDFSKTDHFSYSFHFSKSKGFSESYQFTPSASLIPNDPSCIVESEDGNITFNDRCDYSEFEGKNVTVQIVRSNFTNFVEDKNGAAVHIINCGIKCNGTMFIDCVSTSGAGGGIYINNTIEHRTNVDLINLVFIRCKAFYGGAVFIQSNYEINRILIQSCYFKSNEVYKKKQNSGIFFGGSSIYMISKAADIINNTFVENKGQGGCFKIFDPSSDLTQLEENIKASIKIDGCEFEQSDSIYYESKGNRGGEIEINDCNFKGKLAKGSHYIDGNLLHNNSPKFRIRSCMFEHGINESVNSALIKDISSSKVIEKVSFSDNLNSKKYLNNRFLGLLVISMIVLTIYLITSNRYHRFIANNDDYVNDNFIDKYNSNEKYSKYDI